MSVYCCWIGAKIAKSKYVLWISFSCFFFDYSTWIFIVWIKTMLTDNNAYFKTFKTFFETQLNYSFYKTNQVNSVLKIQNLIVNSLICFIKQEQTTKCSWCSLHVFLKKIHKNCESGLFYWHYRNQNPTTTSIYRTCYHFPVFIWIADEFSFKRK